jgi:hypothetical protein
MLGMNVSTATFQTRDGKSVFPHGYTGLGCARILPLLLGRMDFVGLDRAWRLLERDAARISSTCSDVDQELVTPGFGPCAGSGWPNMVIVRGSGFDDAAHWGEGGVRVGIDSGGESDDANIDVFILGTLAAATNQSP